MEKIEDPRNMIKETKYSNYTFISGEGVSICRAKINQPVVLVDASHSDYCKVLTFLQTLSSLHYAYQACFGIDPKSSSSNTLHHGLFYQGTILRSGPFLELSCSTIIPISWTPWVFYCSHFGTSFLVSPSVEELWSEPALALWNITFRQGLKW